MICLCLSHAIVLIQMILVVLLSLQGGESFLGPWWSDTLRSKGIVFVHLELILSVHDYFGLKLGEHSIFHHRVLDQLAPLLAHHRAAPRSPGRFLRLVTSSLLLLRSLDGVRIEERLEAIHTQAVLERAVEGFNADLLLGGVI